jgi:PHD/YefM family antitoxin component YafN of YafNO toxin-antitoxin module
MFDINRDIQAMTTFRRNLGKFLRPLKKPIVLTINGKAEAVVQDAEAYQRLLDIAAQASASEGIRQGLEDVKKGRMRIAREVLAVTPESKKLRHLLFGKKPTTDLSNYSQSDLNKVALRLNQRPRDTLGFQTPASKLKERFASTH